LPFELPVQCYLEEMLIGLHGSPHKEASGGKKGGGKSRGNWQRMKGVLDGEATRDVCQALFGIVVSVVMKRGSGDAITELREKLARAWALVMLEVTKKANEGLKGTELDAKDWLLRSLPIVLVQCVYRLLVDAFAEDRSQLTHYADELLDKITNVVTYEVCGFKINSSTWQKERRKVFQKAVIENPFVNQHDSLKSQMRREFLENRSKGPMALAFGRQDSLPLEETQLEHIMMNRQIARQKASESGKSLKAFEASEVPSELSVDRYASIAQVGDQLLQKHLEELLPTQGSTLLPSILEARSDRPDSAGAAEIGHEGIQVRTSVMAAPSKELARLKREADQAQKRQREGLLQARILNDPLPTKLCERSFDTAWVSPITDRLVPVGMDRQGLRKRAADSHRIKMGLPNMVQSQSEPSLKTSLKLPKIGQITCNDHLGDSAVHAPAASEKKLHKVITDLTIEPPASLKNAVVLNRLQEHIHTFHSKSFGVYVKEFDIASGQKKQRMDPEAMRRAEMNYVASLHALVGPAREPALKVFDSPERKAKRRAMKK